MNKIHIFLPAVLLSLITACRADYTTYAVQEIAQLDKVLIKETRVTYRQETISSWEPVYCSQTTCCYHKPCCSYYGTSCQSYCSNYCCCHDNCQCTCTTHIEPRYEWRTHYISVPEYHYAYHVLDLVPAVDFGIKVSDYSIIFHACDKLERLGNIAVLHNQLERVMIIATQGSSSYVPYDRINNLMTRMERTGYMSAFEPALEAFSKRICDIVARKRPQSEFIKAKEKLKNVRTGGYIASGAIALGSICAYLSGAISKEACIATTAGCAITAGASTALPSLAPSYRKHIEGLRREIDTQYTLVDRITQSCAFVTSDRAECLLKNMHYQAAVVTSELN